jgi:hypothetical protein
MPPLCPIHVRALQEYLEVLADEDEPPARRQRQLLLSYAEFLFRMRGGSKCAVCRASVRHVLPASVERLNGTLVEYPCLCTRCIEEEKAVSRRVVLRVGHATLEHIAPGHDYDMSPRSNPELPTKKKKNCACMQASGACRLPPRSP